jgi:hypothetical protein
VDRRVRRGDAERVVDVTEHEPGDERQHLARPADSAGDLLDDRDPVVFASERKIVAACAPCGQNALKPRFAAEDKAALSRTREEELPR